MSQPDHVMKIQESIKTDSALPGEGLLWRQTGSVASIRKWSPETRTAFFTSVLRLPTALQRLRAE